MDFFRLAAPFYDTVMNIVGHGNSLETLAERIDLEAGDKLMDLGGGTGQLIDFLPEEADITLVDSSEDMLARARKKYNNGKVDIVKGRGDDLPQADDEFDYIVIADALHHFDEINGTIQELDRVLKPGGEIIILEFNPGSLLTKFISVGESLFGEPANFYYPEELRSLFSQKGYSTSIDNLSNSLYILRGLKGNS